MYRLYRSRKFEDVVGQDHVTTTLKNALKLNRLSHAYLFVGPRGVGKTSVARILAHEANQLPYDGQSNHLDIVEIDGASNRGIDEIRDLREKVHLAPASSRYKVYIIDEVHMLTPPAFSALLKTLEEPPAHVIFILATTEGHKIPPTIISRTQRFTFLPIKPEQTEEHLAKIMAKEKLTAEPEALKLIAYHGFGSLRDSLGLLDQLSSAPGVITAQDVGRLIGLAPDAVVDQLMAAVAGSQAEAISRTIDQVRSKGVSPALLARQLIDKLRHGQPPPSRAEVELFSDLLDVATALEPELKLEAVLLEHSLKSSAATTQPASSAIRPVPAEADEPESAQPASSSPTAGELTDDVWQAILAKVKDGHNSLYAILRQARPTGQPEGLMLEFQFEFHRQRANETQNKRVIEQVISAVLGRPSVIKTSVLSRPPAASPPQTDNMTSVISLMGGGDVMELGDG